MLRSSYFALILTLFITVQVANSYGRYDQDYDDEYEDDYDEPYPRRSQRHSYNRNERGMRYRPQKRLHNYASRGDVGTPRLILDKILAIVSLGTCVTKCLLNNIKYCAGMIGCGWGCFSPEEKGRNINRDQDDENINRPKYTKTTDLRPKDIVRLSVCLFNCLAKYMPRNAGTIKGFATCFVIRCICDEDNK